MSRSGNRPDTVTESRRCPPGPGGFLYGGAFTNSERCLRQIYALDPKIGLTLRSSPPDYLKRRV